MHDNLPSPKISRSRCQCPTEKVSSIQRKCQESGDQRMPLHWLESRSTALVASHFLSTLRRRHLRLQCPFGGPQFSRCCPCLSWTYPTSSKFVECEVTQAHVAVGCNNSWHETGTQGMADCQGIVKGHFDWIGSSWRLVHSSFEGIPSSSQWKTGCGRCYWAVQLWQQAYCPDFLFRALWFHDVDRLWKTHRARLCRLNLQKNQDFSWLCRSQRRVTHLCAHAKNEYLICLWINSGWIVHLHPVLLIWDECEFIVDESWIMNPFIMDDSGWYWMKS